MYSTGHLLKITRELVLKYRSEYDIYCEYLGYQPVIGKLYSSPFRRDSNPSFGLFMGRSRALMFKDFGTGESGDCFKFVQELEGLKPKETLRSIYYRLAKHHFTKKHTKLPELKESETEIVTVKVPFSQISLDYWAKYGISPETLEKFEVSEISQIWVNGVCTARITKDKPSFKYRIFEKCKIYRPFNKENRFINNCGPLHLQGWAQLDENSDTVIITKSLKDVMCLYELGFNAFAVGGEGHALHPKLLTHLRKNYKHIILNYDADTAGIKNARKILRDNKDFSFFFTTKDAKDVSDYYAANGKAETFKFISKKIEHAKKQRKGI